VFDKKVEKVKKEKKKIFLLRFGWSIENIPNICGFGVGQEDEEYHGLSKGETSHIIVWQVHC